MNKLTCPACRSPMERFGHSSGVMLDECFACGSLWLDWDEPRRVAPRPPDEPEVLHALAFEETPGGPNVRRCPRCNDRLVALRSTAYPELHIDGCGAHGIHLDANELETIQHLARHGVPEPPEPGPAPPREPTVLQVSPRDDRPPHVEEMLRRMNERRWVEEPLILKLVRDLHDLF